MHFLGFETVVSDWFKSYVYERRFFINIENEYAECSKIICFIPKECILGPPWCLKLY